MMAVSLEPTVIASPVTGQPVAAVVQALPVKPIWKSRTMQWAAAGFLSLCGVLAISVDQLIPLITGGAEYLPAGWVKIATTALTVVGIVAKYAMAMKRVEVGDLTTGKEPS